VRWALVVLFAVAFVAHATYSSIQVGVAREAVEVAGDSVEVLEALRVPFEAHVDSLRRVVAVQGERLRADSVHSADELERARRRARRATVRASSLADSLRARVDLAALPELDSLLVAHHGEVVALTRQAEIFRAENAALWGNRRTLEELVAAADSVNGSLRVELGLKDLQIAGLTRLVDPPWSLRIFRGAKVALPGIVAGYLLGVVTTG
jgi:hypothetical protein